MSYFPLITIEGADGVGKSTLIETLYSELAEKGYSVKKYRHPGETDVGTMVRSMVIDLDINLSPMTQALLILANRTQLVEQVLTHDINNGTIVLIDRWDLSTEIYQTCVYESEQTTHFGIGDEVSQRITDFHQRLHQVIKLTEPSIPRATILLDADDATLDQRRPFNGDDRFERMDHHFKRRLRQKYRIAQPRLLYEGACYTLNTDHPLTEADYDGLLDFILGQRTDPAT